MSNVPSHRQSRPDEPVVDDLLPGTAEIELEQRRPANVLPVVQRVTMVGTIGDAPAELLAETRFMLAQELWQAPPDRGRDRQRAMMLAEQARDALQAIGERRAKDLAAIEQWVLEHGG